MAVDANGVSFQNIEGTLPTYSIALVDYTPYTTATDMVVLQNPATSTALLKVTRLSVSGEASSTSLMDIYFQIRSALSTGGTSANLTIAKHDSNNVAPTGLAKSFSAAPTLNGTGAYVRADRILMPGNSPNVTPNTVFYDFGVRGGAQSIHLRPGEQLSVTNIGNAVAAGTSLYINIEWVESSGSNPVQ
jgi:hypothetical protein